MLFSAIEVCGNLLQQQQETNTVEESSRQRGRHVQRPGGEQERAEPAGDLEAAAPAVTL